MTHDEIMALEAGPATDELIAKARGWKRGVCPGGIAYDGWMSPKGCWHGAVSPVSTDDNAAMEMQEALTQDQRRVFALKLAGVLGWDIPTKNALGLAVSVAYAMPLDRCKARLLMEVSND